MMIQMMKNGGLMSKVVHFELVAENPKRALEFYDKVFGWNITKWDGLSDYWICKTGRDDEFGIDGAIKPKLQNSKNMLTINSDSLEKSMERIKKAGGVIVSDVIAVPGVVRFCRFRDCEGNELEISEVI